MPKYRPGIEGNYKSIVKFLNENEFIDGVQCVDEHGDVGLDERGRDALLNVGLFSVENDHHDTCDCLVAEPGDYLAFSFTRAFDNWIPFGYDEEFLDDPEMVTF
jgi:hypothetical protein